MTEHEVNELLQKAALAELNAHRHLSAYEYRISSQNKTDLPTRAIAEQIDSYHRAKNKFTSLNLDELLFTKKGIEQATSEFAALAHLDILEGDYLLDMTGSLGFDSIFFAKNFKELTVLEKDKVTFELLNHNLKSILNAEAIHGDSIEYLKTKPKIFDWIYIDPDRRSKQSREIDLRDHQPDCVANFELIKSHAKHIAIKLSPLTNLAEVQKHLPDLNEFIVISVDNECKEVLLIFHQDRTSLDVVEAKMIHSKTKTLSSLKWNGEKKEEKIIADKIGSYLIEPDKAIIKASLSAVFAKKHQLKFINPNSDYLSSDREINATNRCFEILSVLPYKIKLIQNELKRLKIQQASISKRNFTDKTEQIRKKLKLKDGGSHHLHFTRDKENKHICLITLSGK